MQVIAHRGACLEALENSWSAFELAIETKAHRIELDIQLTKDQHLVIVHDNHLTRVSKEAPSLFIATATRQQLEAVKLNNHEPIPFLDEALDRLLPCIELNIEVKPKELICSEILLEMLKKLPKHLQTRIVISSFHHEVMEFFGKQTLGCRLALLWTQTECLPISHHIDWLNEQEPAIIHPNIDDLTEDFRSLAKTNDWQVVPYCSIRQESAQKEALWQKLIDAKVDGFCTNYPRELTSWLKERKL